MKIWQTSTNSKNQIMRLLYAHFICMNHRSDYQPLAIESLKDKWRHSCVEGGGGSWKHPSLVGVGEDVQVFIVLWLKKILWILLKIKRR